MSVNNNRGFMAASMLVIMSVLLLAGMSLLTYVLTTKRAATSIEGETLAVQVAEAGVHKALFCLNASSGDNCGGTFGATYTGEATVDVGSGYFSTNITGDGVNKTITSVGSTYGGYSQTIMANVTTVPPTDDTQFAYALQSGDGGAHLENNAVIHGTLYTNGDVTCQSPQAIVDGDVYVSLANGKIDDCHINYHAHADRIIDCEIGGDAYYNQDPAGIDGSNVDGSKYPGSATADYEEMPSINLEFWQSSAESGGTINGDYSPSDGEVLGPIKIDGNLTMNNNVDIVVTGPIWVVGDIDTGNNSTFTLDPSFGEYGTTILADDPDNQAGAGKINISNNTGIYGSGNPKSHLLFVTTNTSTDPGDPALSISNNSSGAIFFSTQGTLALENNAGAKSLAAYRLQVSQNSEVTYAESDLADAKFSNSPGIRWRLKAGEWRQVK